MKPVRTLVRLVVFCAALGTPAASVAGSRLTDLVNPFVGTAARPRDLDSGVGVGDTFPGAAAPFGMLQWSPDTTPGLTNYGAGYSYEDTRLRGFSLTHLNGVGCPIMMDVPILPVPAAVSSSPALPNSYAVATAYVPTFSHADERAEPGYYRVGLNHDGARTRVELAATTRAGIGRFRFPATAAASVLFNAGGSAMANGDVVVAIDPDRREVSGWVESGQFCYHTNRYRLYFAAEFDRAFSTFGTWTRQTVAPEGTAAADHAEAPFHLRPLGPGSLVPNPPPNSNGAQAGAYVTFDAARARTVRMRVAVSFVSVDHARANLAAEIPGWSLVRVRRQTRASWEELLGRVRVRGGTLPDRRTFYTMLYQTLLAPTVFSDANGDYLGMDGAVRHADGVRYTNFSGWDIYRSQIALLAMLVPERTSDMMRSLIANAAESGWLPRWSLAASHTNVMVGDPAGPILATAHAFGATDFDGAAALAALLRGANQATFDPGGDHVQRQGLEGYLVHGYVPHDGTENSSGGSTSMFGSPLDVWGSAATTLEYVTADFAIARFALALGDTATCRAMASRADGWQRLFNPATGYLQPRYADGSFLDPFDPVDGEGWVEGNAAQYSWMVPHAVGGLAAAFGGVAAAVSRLDAFFTYLNADELFHAHIGNEPSANAPWIYAWLGRPDRAQDVVRRALLTLFDDTPAGYPGNNDMGQLSAWYVFGALGLYPAIPGTDVLVVGSPLFPKTTLHVPGGRIAIRGRGAARARPYATSLALDGQAHPRPWLRYGDLRQGATLDFVLESTPSPTWGRAAEHAPPSFGAGHLDPCAPDAWVLPHGTLQKLSEVPAADRTAAFAASGRA